MGRAVKQAFGKMGESYVADEIRDRGFSVVEVGTRSTTDLIVDNCVTVEVKSATWSNRTVQRGGIYGSYQFRFRRHGLPNDDDFAVLVCFSDDMEAVGSFVIPRAVLGELLKKCAVTSKDPKDYGGKWADYYERWDLIDELVMERDGKAPEPKAKEPIPF